MTDTAMMPVISRAPTATETPMMVGRNQSGRPDACVVGGGGGAKTQLHTISSIRYGVKCNQIITSALLHFQTD